MTFIQLESGPLKLELCPAIGGSITRFDLAKDGKTIPLFRPYDSSLPLSPLNFASFPLTPFSNRISHGKLHFRGAVYDVGPNFGQEQHPNHGDGWTTPWTLQNRTSSEAWLSLRIHSQKQTPYAYEAEQIYRLDEHGLSISMQLTNHSGRAMPFGFGHHPYFMRNDQTILKLNAPRVWTSLNMVPQKEIDVPYRWNFSEGKALSAANLMPAEHGADGTAYIDHCFTGWDQRAEIIWPDQETKLLITSDQVFENFVIYIPSQGDFFCAEPVTNIIDGFNLMENGAADTGTIILEDGETAHGTMRFTVQAA